MRRKSLVLLFLAPVLLILLLIQLTNVQGSRTLAPALQSEPAPAEQAVDEPVPVAGVPLTEPLSIRIRQQVPITLSFALPVARRHTAPAALATASRRLEEGCARAPIL